MLTYGDPYGNAIAGRRCQDTVASITAAVREGRTVYDNIKKVISWTLPTNAGEAMPVIIALFLGMALPITAVQILWVNLIATVTLGPALAFEPSEPGTMRRPTKARGEALLSGELIWHVLLVSLLFSAAVFGIQIHALGKGHSLELAQTIICRPFSPSSARKVYRLQMACSSSWLVSSSSH